MDLDSRQLTKTVPIPSIHIFNYMFLHGTLHVCIQFPYKHERKGISKTNEEHNTNKYWTYKLTVHIEHFTKYCFDDMLWQSNRDSTAAMACFHNSHLGMYLHLGGRVVCRWICSSQGPRSDLIYSSTAL